MLTLFSVKTKSPILAKKKGRTNIVWWDAFTVPGWGCLQVLESYGEWWNFGSSTKSGSEKKRKERMRETVKITKYD